MDLLKQFIMYLGQGLTDRSNINYMLYKILITDIQNECMLKNGFKI